MTETTIMTYRATGNKTLPRWLRKGFDGPVGIAGKVMYALFIVIDDCASMLIAGVKRRFPGYLGEYDSLPLIGAQRRIARGPLETDAGYAARLIPWLDCHRTRGGPYAMLAQLYGFWSGAFQIALVYTSGKRFLLHTDGTITRDYIAGWAGYGVDSMGRTLAQWKLFFQWPTAIGNDGLWGSVGSTGNAFWGDGGIWGVDLTAAQVQNLLLVPTEWNAAHTHGTVCLLPPSVWPDTSHWQDPGLVSLAVF